MTPTGQSGPIAGKATRGHDQGTGGKLTHSATVRGVKSVTQAMGINRHLEP